MKKTISKILGVALAIALLVSMVIGVIPVSAMTQPSVALTGVGTGVANQISSPNSYTITYTSGIWTQPSGQIIVTFPAGTVVSAGLVVGDVSVQATAGVTDALAPTIAFGPLAPASVGVDATQTIVTIGLTAGEVIGNQSIVRIVIGSAAHPVTNPNTAGNFTLKVQANNLTTTTDTETATSAAYGIAAVTIGAIPGIVTGYNSSNQVIYQNNTADSIEGAISAPGAVKIVVGDGTYDITTAIIPLTGQTVVSVNGAGTTIIELSSIGPGVDVQLTNYGVTFGGIGTGFTIENTASPVFAGPENVQLSTNVTAGATATSLNGCIIQTNVTGIPGVVVTGGGAGVNPVSVNNCQIYPNLTAGVVADGIHVSGSTATATVTLEKDVVYVGATENGINVSTTTAGLTIDSCTFTAAPAGNGTGILTAATAGGTISNSTFNSLLTGVSVTSPGANLTIGGMNTFKTCGYAAGTTPATYGGAISSVGAFGATVSIVNNKFTGNVGYSIYIDNAGAGMSATGNTFSGDVLGVDVAAGTLNAALNYWGAAGGPNTTGAEIVVTETTSTVVGTVTVTPMLAVQSTSSSTGAAGAGGASITTSVGGVTVTGVSAAFATTVAAFGTTDPSTVLPPYTANALYFDVYTSGISTSTVNIQFFTPTINAGTLVYFFSPLLSQWVQCNTTAISGTGAYVLLTLGVPPWGVVNPMTTPNVGDLNGTVFAVVSGPAPVTTPTYVNLITPTTGSMISMLTNIPFAWSPVTGAASYTFKLSPNPDMSTPIVVQSTTSTVYTYTGTLVPGPYYWQVITAVGSTDINSLTGVFVAQAPTTTATIPPATTVVTSVVITQPITTTMLTTTQTVIQNTTTQTTVTNTNTSTQVTPSWIWGIIGIGAILIIVVIVLIVRTRRTV